MTSDSFFELLIDMRRIWPVPQILYTSLADHTEDRDVMMLYSRAAWEAVRDGLRLKPRTRAEVLEATEAHWNAISEPLEGEVVYAVGGGLAVDAAKYVAVRRGLPLVCVPTAISVDAFFTWSSGVREGGCVKYLETKPPDRILINFDMLRNAPAELRASGIGDVLSIATGCADWAYADEKGENPPTMPYLPSVADTAQSILRGVMEAAEAAGRGEPDGLARLIEALVLEVQLCNLIGHSRPEEGSEHYFAYCAESLMGPGHSHGELVGPGILMTARLHGLEVSPLERALRACHVPLDRIPESVMTEATQQLASYCRQFDLPYGIAHDLKTT